MQRVVGKQHISNPYKEAFGDGGTEISEDAPDWENAWFVTLKCWCKIMQDNHKMKEQASIKDFVLHLIKTGQGRYKGG